MRYFLPLLAISMAAVSHPAKAVPLQPTGKWVVDFADAQCVASLAYGEELVFLKASPAGDIVQFGIREPGRSGLPRQIDAAIEPASGAPFVGNALLWTSKGEKPFRMRMINMPAAEFERLSASPVLTFKIGEMTRSYAMPAMTALQGVMKTCVDDLQKSWSSEGGVAAKAEANLVSYFKDDDYPDDAIRNENSGSTAFSLLIDEKGRVVDCMVTQTSGHALLDTQSCAIVKTRARFTPARDLAGKPTRDRATSRINWRLP